MSEENNIEDHYQGKEKLFINSIFQSVIRRPSKVENVVKEEEQLEEETEINKSELKQEKSQSVDLDNIVENEDEPTKSMATGFVDNILSSRKGHCEIFDHEENEDEPELNNSVAVVKSLEENEDEPELNNSDAEVKDLEENEDEPTKSMAIGFVDNILSSRKGHCEIFDQEENEDEPELNNSDAVVKSLEENEDEPELNNSDAEVKNLENNEDEPELNNSDAEVKNLENNEDEPELNNSDAVVKDLEENEDEPTKSMATGFVDNILSSRKGHCEIFDQENNEDEPELNNSDAEVKNLEENEDEPELNNSDAVVKSLEENEDEPELNNSDAEVKNLENNEDEPELNNSDAEVKSFEELELVYRMTTINFVTSILCKEYTLYDQISFGKHKLTKLKTVLLKDHSLEILNEGDEEENDMMERFEENFNEKYTKNNEENKIEAHCDQVSFGKHRLTKLKTVLLKEPSLEILNESANEEENDMMERSEENEEEDFIQNNNAEVEGNTSEIESSKRESIKASQKNWVEENVDVKEKEDTDEYTEKFENKSIVEEEVVVSSEEKQDTNLVLNESVKEKDEITEEKHEYISIDKREFAKEKDEIVIHTEEKEEAKEEIIVHNEGENETDIKINPEPEKEDIINKEPEKEDIINKDPIPEKEEINHPTEEKKENNSIVHYEPVKEMGDISWNEDKDLINPIVGNEITKEKEDANVAEKNENKSIHIQSDKEKEEINASTVEKHETTHLIVTEPVEEKEKNLVPSEEKHATKLIVTKSAKDKEEIDVKTEEKHDTNTNLHKESVKEKEKIITPNKESNLILNELIKEDSRIITEQKKNSINHLNKKEDKILTSGKKAKVSVKAEEEHLISEKKETYEDDEEIRNYINSIKVNKEDESSANKKEKKISKEKSKDVQEKKSKDYDDYLQKIEDSINDNANNNYDFDVDDDIFTNTNKIEAELTEITDKKLDLEFEDKSGSPKHKNKVIKSDIKIIDKKKIPISTDTEYRAHKKMAQSYTKINEKTPLKIPLKLKSNYLSKTKDNFFSERESKYPSPWKAYDNSSGYLYKKENKLSQSKVIKDKAIFSKTNLNFKQMAKDQIEELKRKKDENSRNYTAKSRFNAGSKFKLMTVQTNTTYQKREFSSKLINRKCEEQKKNFLQLMNDPRNPYSTHWFNKILDRQFKLEIGVSGFCNGVPLIKLKKKKEGELPLLTNKVNEILNEENQSQQQDVLFNSNMKNFYKLRKDIQEETIENENRESFDNSGEIEFPVIINYLKK